MGFTGELVTGENKHSTTFRSHILMLNMYLLSSDEDEVS